MNHMIIPPFDPKQSEPVRPSMVYVKKSLKWEYKQIVRNLESEYPLDEAELNVLGEGVLQVPLVVYGLGDRPPCQCCGNQYCYNRGPSCDTFHTVSSLMVIMFCL